MATWVPYSPQQNMPPPHPLTCHPLPTLPFQEPPPSSPQTAPDPKLRPLNDNSINPFANGRNTKISPTLVRNSSKTVYVENSSSRFYLISCSQGILNSSRLLLLSSPKIACLHVSFTAYENFYKLSKMHCHLVLTFLFLILRMSECRNPTIKHISTYTLVSSSITTYVIDLFLGSNLYSKIPF